MLHVGNTVLNDDDKRFSIYANNSFTSVPRGLETFKLIWVFEKYIGIPGKTGVSLIWRITAVKLSGNYTEKYMGLVVFA